MHEIIESFLQQNPALWEEVYWSKRLQRRIFNAVKAKDRGLVDRLLALDPRFIVNSWTDEEAGYRSCSLVALACQHGSAEILQLLLNRLGDLFQKIKEIQIETGRTELFFDAAYFIGVDGARLIGDKLGANEDTYRILIHSLIIAGEEEKYLKIVDVCLRLHPVLLEKMNEDGQMPIHTAAMHGRNKFIELLLEKGASAKVANAHGKRAVDLAREARHDETAQFIEQRRLAIKLRPFLQPLEAQLRTQQEAQTAAWKAWHHEKTTQLKHLSLEVQLGTPGAIDVIVSQLQQYPSVKRLTLLGVNNSLLKHSVGVAALSCDSASGIFFGADFQGGLYTITRGDQYQPWGATASEGYQVRRCGNCPQGTTGVAVYDNSERMVIGTLDGCVFGGRQRQSRDDYYPKFPKM